MKVLFNKTFIKMFKLIPVAIIVVISAGFGVVLANQYSNVMASLPTYSYLSQQLTLIFSMLAFILLSGILIWVICANSASGLFASEIHEGTMRLLISKEISRKELVIGKVGGMLAGSIVYLVLSFASFLLVFTLISGVEKDILWVILKASGVFILYGIVSIFIVGALGTFLSTCFKKKVPAILLLAALAALVFGVIPIGRMILSAFGIYDKMHLYLFDINYHFGLIFNQFLNMLGGLGGSQGELGTLGMFTNLFTYGQIDYDLTFQPQYVLNQTLNGTLITAIYLAISCGLYALSGLKMTKKDI